MSRRGWLLFGAMCVIWGIPYLQIRVAVRELTPATLVFWRCVLGALVLLPLTLRRADLPALVRHWRPLLLFAAIEIALPWLLLAHAETDLSSSLTGLLIAAVPIVSVVVIAATGGGERIGAFRLAGLGLGVAGVALIVGLDVSGSALALGEIAAVAVCYAVGPIILSRHLSHLPSLDVIVASLGVCALAYLPVAMLQLPSSVPSGRVLMSVVGLAVVCTAVAFLIFFALIAEVGPMRATVITYVNPAVAAVAGVLVLGESLTLGMGAGFALVLAGSVLATRRGAQATPRPAAAAEA